MLKNNFNIENLRKQPSCWTHGLSKEDPKFKASIEKGRITQIRNQKSKGSNNPMFGKPAKHGKSGYRKDLGHSVRSSWEATFARILNYLKIPYFYEKKTFLLDEGDTYTPDFYVPSKDKYYEVKGFYDNDKYLRFEKQYSVKVTLIKERFYNKLVRIFSRHIPLEDKGTLLTRSELKDRFIHYYKDCDKKGTLSDFCKNSKINVRNFKNYFGSIPKFNKELQYIMANLDKSKLQDKFISCSENLGRSPTFLELCEFYPRTSSILQKSYGRKGMSALVAELGAEHNRLHWTPVEDELLRNNYKNNNVRLLFPHRTKSAISGRLHVLKLTDPNYWSEADTQLLIKYYQIEDKKQLLLRLVNKTWPAIVSKATRLLLCKTDSVKNKWTDLELKTLSQLYYSSPKEIILEALRDRSWNAIKTRAARLNVKREYREE